MGVITRMPGPGDPSRVPAADRPRPAWRDRLLCEWWSIGVTARPIGAVLDRGGLGPVRWLDPARSAAYRADPFAWPGTDLMLCEECGVAGGTGRIVAGRVTRLGFEPVAALLDDGIHRSYPFVWQDGGTTYLLPEAHQAGATLLYRLDADFSTRPVAVIAPERRLVDPTLFEAAGRLWIAATDLAFGSDDNLCLFTADRPEGPWRAHRGNPVVVGRRTARSGGTPFRHRGLLHRPAQDCTTTYGGALVIAAITTLTPDDYEERVVCRLDPDPAGPLPHGLHTLSADGDRCLIDGKRMVFVPAVVAGKLRRRMVGGAVP